MPTMPMYIQVARPTCTWPGLDSTYIAGSTYYSNMCICYYVAAPTYYCRIHHAVVVREIEVIVGMVKVVVSPDHHRPA